MDDRRAFLGRTAAAVGLLALPAIARGADRATAGQVETVLGPIQAERLGVTSAHEHIAANSTDLLRLWPEIVGGRDALADRAVAGLKAANNAGIDTIVDCTTADLGRDIRLLQEVSRRSGVHVVATTGHWLTPTPAFEARSADELADFFTLEITRGIENSGVRPGVIKAASQGEGMTPFQEKVFRAAARASKRTGMPVTTHSAARNRGGEQQAMIFEQEKLDPTMVCIGHSDESADFGYLYGLARRGYTLGFDHLFYGLPAMGGGTGGVPGWQDRAKMLKRLIDAGFADRLMLGNDWMYALGMSATGTMARLDERNPDGLLFNVRHTIPYLREMGVTGDQLRTIQVRNPARFFAGRASS